MNGDPGYFGPESMMWKVNKEITVLFGGARALLMHAAHPLIGGSKTKIYWWAQRHASFEEKMSNLPRQKISNMFIDHGPIPNIELRIEI